jgi:hypothetical protein
MVGLGSKVRDVVTGFEGVAFGRHTYLTGCVKITVEPAKLNTADGLPAKSEWFDEQRLEVLAEPDPAFVERMRQVGGPADMPREVQLRPPEP